jgi:hypothetical protein
MVRRCDVCLCVKRIVGGFQACFHVILCKDCVVQVNLHCRLENGKVACIRCRTENEEARIAYF